MEADLKERVRESETARVEKGEGKRWSERKIEIEKEKERQREKRERRERRKETEQPMCLRHPLSIVSSAYGVATVSRID